MEKSYRIVRRAFGVYETVETGVSDWMTVELRAMELEALNRDGEYLTRYDGAPDIHPPSAPCPVQAAFAYL